jgi:hypothetical protein
MFSRIGDIVISASSVAAIPGQAGVFEVEILAPPGIPEDDAVPLTILSSASGTAASNTVTLPSSRRVPLPRLELSLPADVSRAGC